MRSAEKARTRKVCTGSFVGQLPWSREMANPSMQNFRQDNSLGKINRTTRRHFANIDIRQGNWCTLLYASHSKCYSQQ